VQGLDGKLYRLSDFRGKPVVLNFWASWCDPCRAEMPLLNDTYKKQMKNDLVVLALNLSENVQTVKGFAKEYKLAFPILLDNDSAIADQYGIDPIPTSFFVNREGVIKNVHIGELDQETLELNLQKIMP
jgi:peroxiredoxin